MLLIDSDELKIDIDLNQSIRFTVDIDGLFFQHEVLEIEDVFDSDGRKIPNKRLFQSFLREFAELGGKTVGLCDCGAEQREISFQGGSQVVVDYKNGGHWFNIPVDWEDLPSLALQ